MAIGTDGSLSFIHFEGVATPPRLRHAGTAATGHSHFSPSIGTDHRPQAVSDSPAKPESFVTWLLERAGLFPDVYRAAPLHRRLPALLRRLRVRSPEAARTLLEAKPELMLAALNSMLIGTSSFFRDATVFDCLRERLLPELLQTRDNVRVFGAGVSGGHEIYSVAILLAEAGRLEGSSLVGVDCRPGAIERARQGYFEESELEEIRSVWRDRYFYTDRGLRRANEGLRCSVRWHCADLFAFPLPACDLILFRNLAIYLEARSAGLMWEKLCSALTPGGLLITGKAEKPPDTLPLRCLFKSIYQKKGTVL